MAAVDICQSCGMPMDADEKFGTNATGGRNDLYCIHCYRDGKFTQPDMTVETMIDRVAGFVSAETGISSELARTRAAELLPKLERWQQGTLQ